MNTVLPGSLPDPTTKSLSDDEIAEIIKDAACFFQEKDKISLLTGLDACQLEAFCLKYFHRSFNATVDYCRAVSHLDTDHVLKELMLKGNAAALTAYVTYVDRHQSEVDINDRTVKIIGNVNVAQVSDDSGIDSDGGYKVNK